MLRVYPLLFVLVLSVLACERSEPPAASTRHDTSPQPTSGPAPMQAHVCPGMQFTDFLAAFAEDSTVQRQWTRFPLEELSLIDGEIEPQQIVDSVTPETIRWPLFPSASQRAAELRTLEIEPMQGDSLRVMVEKPDTDWVVHYIFAAESACWRLERIEDWSL